MERNFVAIETRELTLAGFLFPDSLQKPDCLSRACITSLDDESFA